MGGLPARRAQKMLGPQARYRCNNMKMGSQARRVRSLERRMCEWNSTPSCAAKIWIKRILDRQAPHCLGSELRMEARLTVRPLDGSRASETRSPERPKKALSHRAVELALRRSSASVAVRHHMGLASQGTSATATPNRVTQSKAFRATDR